ncbi:sulfurtransferase complex subunit TusB [Pasteurella skyensis]|uniref:Sulfurtransferase complex subunit TusB n=1 Tax=Phocoenobacter skyensis TaxID=97481 RepID=A0AAJ6NAW6_9PAST|nr:sulfurtransferase complex subunit TusB [Pasteurella skyensis]MDP8162686.1 sulfurtransferase complex subunit TusB [Pasteurella skyensis]MDP8173454.1 sulfurtransferase complex subunit TusB [Pasteurella skyensis]MDP8177627.1 sulfurtransferase complex subunit TusB [Pasteurella skyensis]MDP8178788.1 sulfurtransferase complex subunit TusB [Pasteurella skyensis]MDP8183088.1 sulfurtransferase complex subunit TusB [Pasteurella skyensis]
MLYTLSKSHYNIDDLESILSHITEQDAVILWQDGVLLAVRSSQLFANIKNIFILDSDVTARGLTLSSELKRVSLPELIAITEKFYPQIAL